jgi:citrate synthase
MGFPTDFFPVLFAIPRVAGWLAHWKESLEDTEGGKIWRPRQVYVGPSERPYIDWEHRSKDMPICTQTSSHPFNKRTNIANEAVKSNL